MTWSTTVMVMLHVFLSSLHIFTSLGNISRTSISSLFHQKEREYNSRMFTGSREKTNQLFHDFYDKRYKVCEPRKFSYLEICKK